nr:MAG TPA: hypothetical protein [Caudoviricetes sp.]
MLPAPAPWPYIADFTRPEGHIWYGIAALPCFSASAIIRRHSLWSPLTGRLCRMLPSTARPEGRAIKGG